MVWHRESCASRIANPSRGQFGREARLVLQTEELDLLALLVYLLSSEVDKARAESTAETESAVEVRVAIMFVSKLAAGAFTLLLPLIARGAGFAASTASQGRSSPNLCST